MKPIHIFISSVQKEFAQERAALRDYLRSDPLFLTKYIEKAGSGTVDMVNRCRAAGLRQPEFLIDSGFFVLTIWRKVVPDSVVQVDKSQIESVSGVDKIGTMSALSRHQVEILHKCLIDMGIIELMEVAGRADRTKFRNQVINPLIEAELLEMTVPDKPRSSKQKYRATEKGRALLKKQTREADTDGK
ncbi:MAG: hypothetical protein K0B14_14915 [Anaerolineaceae bacterium]|nr:hypothetical protein [Anaerolineaceae bacterium]